MRGLAAALSLSTYIHRNSSLLKLAPNMSRSKPYAISSFCIFEIHSLTIILHAVPTELHYLQRTYMQHLYHCWYVSGTALKKE